MFYLIDLFESQPMLISAESEREAVDSAKQIYMKEYLDIPKISSVKILEPREGKYKTKLNLSEPWYKNNLYAIDTETAREENVERWKPDKHLDRIIEIAITKFSPADKKFVPVVCSFINPGFELKEKSFSGISNDDVKLAPSFKEFFETYLRCTVDDSLWIFYNREFDGKIIMGEMFRYKIDSFLPPMLCGLELARSIDIGQSRNNKLGNIAKLLNISGENTHRAMDDALLAGQVFLALTKFKPDILRASTQDIIERYQ